MIRNKTRCFFVSVGLNILTFSAILPYMFYTLGFPHDFGFIRRNTTLTSHAVRSETKDITHRCRVQFIVAGKYDDYDPKRILKWLAMSDPSCAIEIMRYSSLNTLLTREEKDALAKSASIPAVQADLMKFLVMYYYGGLIADFDVKVYP